MAITKAFVNAHGVETTLEKFVIVPVTEVVQQMHKMPIGNLNFEYRRLVWRGYVYASMFDVPLHEFTGLTPSGVIHRLWRDHVIERKE